MPADVAAKKIVAAAYRRRREAIVTVHGKALVWLQRFAPWVLRLAMRRGVQGAPRAEAPLAAQRSRRGYRYGNGASAGVAPAGSGARDVFDIIETIV